MAESGNIRAGCFGGITIPERYYKKIEMLGRTLMGNFECGVPAIITGRREK